MRKKGRVSVVVVYAPVEWTDRNSSGSDKFYFQQQGQIDRVPGRNMKFLVKDFNALCARYMGKLFFNIKSKDHHLVVSRVNLKMKFRKNNYLLGSYDAGRLHDKNLRETFQEEFKI